MSCQSHQDRWSTKFRRPLDRPRREATADRQLLAVEVHYSPDLVRHYTGRSRALFYLRTDMAVVRLAAADMVGMAAVDRARGVAAVDPATATTQLAHQKQQRTVPLDSRRHAGVDSDIDYARVVHQTEVDSNSQHAVEDTHTVEAYLALIPNFRTDHVKRSSNGGLPAPASAEGILRVVAAVLDCRGSDIDSVPDLVVEPLYFPYFHSFLLCLAADIHAAAVDTAAVVVKDVAEDADNRVVVVVDHPYSRGCPCVRGQPPYFHGYPCARD
jgi:hypothetical protein